MKLVLFTAAAGPTWGVLSSDGVVSIADIVAADSPQEGLERLIDDWDALRPRLQGIDSERAMPLHSVRLLPPVPRPSKILWTTAVYASGAEQQQLLMTLKSAESVIGPDDTIRLPDVGDAWQFVPRASLGLVMRGPAKRVAADAWRSAVFGFTCAVDVMALGDQQFGRDYWLAKADSLGPLGPCIVTADEIADPSILRVRSWQNGSPAQDFLIDDASHAISEQVEFATTIMTLQSADVLECGTSVAGPRPLADGDRVEVEIDGIGHMALKVAALVGSRS